MDPCRGGLSDENLAWLLLRHGPLGRAQVIRWAGVTSYAVAQTNLGRVTRTLFPTTDVTFAYVLLFGAYTGIVPDGIADLGMPDIDWAGEATILLDYVKGRSGPQSLTLPRQAVRLLEQWLEHSAPLRRVVGEELRSALWIRLNQGLGPTPTSEAGTPASRPVSRFRCTAAASAPPTRTCCPVAAGPAAPPSTRTTAPRSRAITT
jgi:integrase